MFLLLLIMIITKQEEVVHMNIQFNIGTIIETILQLTTLKNNTFGTNKFV